MSIESLEKRAQYLKGQLEEASECAAKLSNQLQQATIDMHTVSGHLNEVNYLLSEAQKEVLNVDVDNEKKEQAPQE